MASFICYGHILLSNPACPSILWLCYVYYITHTRAQAHCSAYHTYSNAGVNSCYGWIGLFKIPGNHLFAKVRYNSNQSTPCNADSSTSELFAYYSLYSYSFYLHRKVKMNGNWDCDRSTENKAPLTLTKLGYTMFTREHLTRVNVFIAHYYKRNPGYKQSKCVYT